MLVKEPIDELNDRQGAYDVSKLVKELKPELDYKAIYQTGYYDDYYKTYELDK